MENMLRALWRLHTILPLTARVPARRSRRHERESTAARGSRASRPREAGHMTRLVTRFGRRAALAALGSLVAAPAVHAQQRSINLMAYSGIFQDLYTRAVIEPFMR